MFGEQMMIPKVAKWVPSKERETNKGGSAKTETDASTIVVSDVNMLGINNGEEMANNREKQRGVMVAAAKTLNTKSQKEEVMADDGLEREKDGTDPVAVYKRWMKKKIINFVLRKQMDKK